LAFLPTTIHFNLQHLLHQLHLIGYFRRRHRPRQAFLLGERCGGSRIRFRLGDELSDGSAALAESVDLLAGFGCGFALVDGGLGSVYQPIEKKLAGVIRKVATKGLIFENPANQKLAIHYISLVLASVEFFVLASVEA
jgi:hypothetical protein